MFQTITANPLLIKQGLYVCMTQVDAKDKSKKRYVLLGSTDLTALTFESKEAFEKAVQAVVDGVTPEPEVTTEVTPEVTPEVEETPEDVTDET
jgi:hypothetical protein